VSTAHSTTILKTMT